MDLSWLHSFAEPPSSPPQDDDHQDREEFEYEYDAYIPDQRVASPHPELSPRTLDARTRSWSQSSSTTKTASEVYARSREESQYWTPEGTFERGGTPRSQAHASGASPLQLPASPPPGSSLGNPVFTRTYTEEWIRQSGYEPSRASSDWVFSEDERSDGSEADNNYLRPHRRNSSLTKTITPADFEEWATLGHLPGSDEDELVVSGHGSFTCFRTAPQSLDGALEQEDMTAVTNRWAATPESEPEVVSEVVEVVQVPVAALKEDPLVVAEEVAETPAITPSVASNGVASFLVPPTTKTASSTRSSSPNIRKSIKWQKRNLIINIPHEVPFGLPEEEGGRPMPLTREEVEVRMQAWREQGYDVEAIGEDGQNMEVFPTEARGTKVEPSDMIVSIPDRRGEF